MSREKQHTESAPTARQGESVVMARRPGGAVDRDDFAVRRRRIAPPGDGEVLIRHQVTSVDPYQLNNMRRHQQVGDIVEAGCVGVVVESNDSRAPVGTQVATYSGWTEYSTRRLAATEFADRALGDELDWIHVLGTPGVTAYVGLHDVGGVSAGWTVAVSAAAGAVGGVAVQLAKAAGARVIAIAGGSDRVRHTTDVLGADIGLDYRTDTFERDLRTAAGNGIDLFFDNVGGSLLRSTLPLLTASGKAVISGRVSAYVTDEGGPAHPGDPDTEQRTVQGFLVGDYYPTRLLPVRAELARLLEAGQLTTVVSEFEGLGSAPEAFASVFRQGSPYLGKRVVRIARDQST
ncbi:MULTISPECIES: MDR family NADP-dependent oxidoreductase [unclassified Streptomyces]|uniref:MDR family NADP-dependent oxidoreductase n=1 Tax=unclassified Streptomyces TaxID=2593676 RepID=UPI0013715010|nr:NADP-dependent oxidoreductase [Streptomyces sp. DvalAA-14]MYS20248.1 zinc-binding dehydrogenase [Streptomyces sp. SID4948]